MSFVKVHHVPHQNDPSPEFELFTQLQPSDISYKVRSEPKMAKYYILGEVLGEGSYAKVREAVNSKTSRRVAIKILKKRHLKKIPGGEASVKREITVLKKLKHKHIVELVEFFTIDEKEKMYIVLEYVGGGTLQGLIERAPNGILPRRQAQLIFRQLLEAVDYIHNQNIVHGDIKPDNIMFDDTGMLKMSDFGVAEELGHEGGHDTEYEVLSKSGGSPAFQPPEVATGSAMQSSLTKVDVWALGITLYIMACGKYPFSGTNVYTLYDSISKGSYEVPTNLEPDLADLIYKILQIDPRQRLSVEQMRCHPWLTNDIVAQEGEENIEFIAYTMHSPTDPSQIHNIFAQNERSPNTHTYASDESEDDTPPGATTPVDIPRGSVSSSHRPPSVALSLSGERVRSPSALSSSPKIRTPRKVKCSVM